MKTLKIIIPYSDKVAIHPRTDACLNNICDYFARKNILVGVLRLRYTTCEEGRNYGIRSNIKTGKCESTDRTRYEVDDCDYAMVLDSDNAITPEQIEQLIARDLPVISPAYPYRGDPTRYVCGASKGPLRGVNLTPASKGLQAVDWFGGGCTIFQSYVFNKIDWPYYYRERVTYIDSDGFDCVAYPSEDVGLCNNLKKNGFDLIVDCDCVIEHLTEGKGGHMNESMVQKIRENITGAEYRMLKARENYNAAVNSVLIYTQQLVDIVAEVSEKEKPLDEK